MCLFCDIVKDLCILLNKIKLYFNYFIECVLDNLYVEIITMESQSHSMETETCIQCILKAVIE